MMIMDVLPIGFFFHRHDFVQADIIRDAAGENARVAKVEKADTVADRDEEKSLHMSLNAYKFF